MRRRGRLVAALAALLLLFATPAFAHREPSAQALKADGISIPSLTHGQMAVIARHRGDILGLAARRMPTDETMRRLVSFIAIQRFACWFGLMPGSLADEASPFNECAHAYLAGTRALLMHLRHMPGDSSAANALAETIELEMLGNNASLAMCAYSEEPFSTAEIVGPHWGDIPRHRPTLAAFGGLAVVLVACCGLAARRRRGRTPVSLGVAKP